MVTELKGLEVEHDRAVSIYEVLGGAARFARGDFNTDELVFGPKHRFT